MFLFAECDHQAERLLTAVRELIMKSCNPIIVEDLIRLAPHTEVVHHIPGRVRIKILPSGFKMAQEMDMDAMIQHIPGISQIRVNPVARSLVIEYDKNRLPYDLWEKMRQLRHNPGVEMEIRARLQNVCI